MQFMVMFYVVGELEGLTEEQLKEILISRFDIDDGFIYPSLKNTLRPLFLVLASVGVRSDSSMEDFWDSLREVFKEGESFSLLEGSEDYFSNKYGDIFPLI